MDLIIDPEAQKIVPAPDSYKGSVIKSGVRSKNDFINRVYHWFGRNIFLKDMGNDLDKSSLIDYLAEKMKEIEESGRVFVPKELKLKQGFFVDSDEKVLGAFDYVLRAMSMSVMRNKVKREPEHHEIKSEYSPKEEKLFGVKDDEILGNEVEEINKWTAEEKEVKKPKWRSRPPDLFEEGDRISQISKSQWFGVEDWMNSPEIEEKPLFEVENEELKVYEDEKIYKFVERFNHFSSEHEVIKSEDGYAVRFIFADDEERDTFIHKNEILLSPDIDDRSYERGAEHDLILTPRQTSKLVPHFSESPVQKRKDYDSIMEQMFNIQEENKKK